MVGLATSPPSALPQSAPQPASTGRYCRGQEHRDFAPRTGSFATGQTQQSLLGASSGRFSTGQETRSATHRMGSFADRTIATVHP